MPTPRLVSKVLSRTQALLFARLAMRAIPTYRKSGRLFILRDMGVSRQPIAGSCEASDNYRRNGNLNLREVAQPEGRCAVRRTENMAIRRRESCKRRSRILDSCGC